MEYYSNYKESKNPNKDLLKMLFFTFVVTFMLISPLLFLMLIIKG
jgi:hypothetical protein